MRFRKKAQIGGFQGFILSIVTVAIVLAIGLIVMNEMRDAAKVLATSSIINESVASGSSLVQSGELLVGASACRNYTGGAEDLRVLGANCNI